MSTCDDEEEGKRTPSTKIMISVTVSIVRIGIRVKTQNVKTTVVLIVGPHFLFFYFLFLL